MKGKILTTDQVRGILDGRVNTEQAIDKVKAAQNVVETKMDKQTAEKICREIGCSGMSDSCKAKPQECNIIKRIGRIHLLSCGV
jgi:hypothetical protein